MYKRQVLTASILKRAKATALQSAIVKNAENELEVSRLLTDEVKKRSKLQSDKSVLFPLGAPSEFANSLGVAAGKGRGAFDALTGSIEDSTEEIGTLNAALANISKDSEDLIERFQALGGIDLTNIKLPEGEKLVLRPKVVIIPKEIKFEPIESDETLAKDIEEALVGPLFNLPNQIDSAAIKAKIALENFKDDAKVIIQGGFSDTFGELGSIIGRSLIEGGNVLDSIGNTLLQGIGNFLSRMGKLLIEYGTLAVVKGKLDLAIMSGGVTSIAAGLVAIGVGVALNAAGGAFGSIASGNSGGGSVSSGGSSSSGSFSSSGGGFGNGNVVFEISGRNLVGVLRRNTDSNLAING